MEYVQMTLNDWVQMKQALERELNNLKTGFVRVGYVLRKIEESKAYEQDGYTSIVEFAQKEYGLSKTSISRFMAVNAKFSLGGFSEQLDPQYVGFRQTTLIEMLTMDQEDIALITPQTKREDIRELKQLSKEQAQEDVETPPDPFGEFLEEYFFRRKDDLEMIFKGGTLNADIVKDTLNPSGNGAYRKGMYMMFFYESCVKVKHFRDGITQYTWPEFAEKINAVFGAYAAAHGGCEKYYDAPDPEPDVSEEEPETIKEDPPEEAPARPEEPRREEEEETEEKAEAEDLPDEEPEEKEDAGEEQQETEEDTEAEAFPMPEPVEETAGAEGDQKAEEEDQEAEEPEETEEEQPTEAPEAVAPAQKEPGISDISQTHPAVVDEKPQIIKDIESMMKSLKSAVKEGSWNTALSYCQGLEGAIRKCLKEGVKSK